MSCLSLGGEISALKVETIFNSRKGFTGSFMNLFLVFPYPFPCLPPQLAPFLPAGVCQSWVPDAKWWSPCSSHSWTCYWLALPESNRIADYYRRAAATCSVSKCCQREPEQAEGDFRGVFPHPLLNHCCCLQGGKRATFSDSLRVSGTDRMCGSVQPQRGFWQLAGAAVLALLSCKN